MALTTKAFEGKVEEKSDPEYEVVANSEGKMHLQKITSSVKKAVKETKEAVEAIVDVPKTIAKAIKSRKKK